MFGLFGKKTDNGLWLEVARAQTQLVSTVSDALLRGATAVARDPLGGWNFEPEVMSNLETYKRQYQTIYSAFNSIGAPRSSLELDNIKQQIDKFFIYCPLAFHWGQYHYKDASGGPGERAKYEYGMAQKAAIKRITNSGTKFKDNALMAGQYGQAALDLIEKSNI